MNIKINTTTILIAVAVYFFFIRKSSSTPVIASPVDDMSPMNNSYGV